MSGIILKTLVTPYSTFIDKWLSKINKFLLRSFHINDEYFFRLTHLMELICLQL